MCAPAVLLELLSLDVAGRSLQCARPGFALRSCASSLIAAKSVRKQAWKGTPRELPVLLLLLLLPAGLHSQSALCNPRGLHAAAPVRGTDCNAQLSPIFLTLALVSVPAYDTAMSPGRESKSRTHQLSRLAIHGGPGPWPGLGSTREPGT